MRPFGSTDYARPLRAASFNAANTELGSGTPSAPRAERPGAAARGLRFLVRHPTAVLEGLQRRLSGDGMDFASSSRLSISGSPLGRRPLLFRTAADPYRATARRPLPRLALAGRGYRAIARGAKADIGSRCGLAPPLFSERTSHDL
jgi:hypothetical protein